MSTKIKIKRRSLIKFGLFGLANIAFNQFSFPKSIINNDYKQNNKIIGFRFWPSRYYSRLIIETKFDLNIKYFTLNHPLRLVLDIYDIKLQEIQDKFYITNSFAGSGIIKIKIGQFQNSCVRIVLYLKNQLVVKSQKLLPVKFNKLNYQYRFLLDLYMIKSEDIQVNQNDDLLALLQLKNQILQNPSEINKRNTYSSVQELKHKKTPNKGKILVLLDPGHGGEDPGAIGFYQLQEKHIVLDIAKKLYVLINQTSYMQAQLTRDSDIFIPLDTRVAIARQSHADLFISIHADAFNSESPSGSSVFVLSNKGASSVAARFLANSQNASDKIGGVIFKNHSPIIQKVLLDMTQTWTQRQSIYLANIIKNSVGKIHKLHANQIEKANFRVLMAPEIPSILVETAFLSNKIDAFNLKQVSFRDKIAHALFTGISNYSKILL